MAEAMRAYYGDADLMRRLLAAPGLDPQWDGRRRSRCCGRRRTAAIGAARTGQRADRARSAPAGHAGPRRRCAARQRAPPNWATARSGSTSMCRSASRAAATATSTPTPPPSSAPRVSAGHLPRPGRSRRSGWPAGCSGAAAGPVGTVFFGGGTPTLLPRAARGDPAGHRRRIRPGAGAEVTVEANPESVDEKSLAALRGRVHPDLPGHAERGAARAGRAGPGAPARPARPLRPVGPGGGLRARQPGPHLRHAGGDRRGLAASRSTRPWRRARTTSPATP